jgi:mono/diheme cytochrome c family protein
MSTLRTLSWIVTLTLCTVATVCAADETGRTLYLRYCAACHGRSGRGDGPVAPALGQQPTDLTLIADSHGGKFPLEAVVEAIDGTRTVRAHGVSEMPVWGQVFRSDRSPSGQQTAMHAKVLAIANYLRSLQGAPAPSR